MEMMTKPVEMNRVTKNFTHQFVVDEDYNVPDSKNDIEKIVMSEGRIKINEAKPTENYLRVQGFLEFQVLYAAEGVESAYEAMEGKLPFAEMVYAEDKIDIKDIHVEFCASLVHSRKVRIKAIVELTLETEVQEVEEIPTDFEWLVKRLRLYNPFGDYILIMLHYLYH